MTVEASHSSSADDVAFQVFELKKNHPSSLLASTNEDNELRNVTFKAVVASKYTLLNEALLELLGVTKGKTEFETSSGVESYQERLQRLQKECAELQQEKDLGFKNSDKELDDKLSKLNADLELELKDFPPGHKVVPVIEPHYTIKTNLFKSNILTYERASTAEKEDQITNLSQVSLEPVTLVVVEEETVPTDISEVTDLVLVPDVAAALSITEDQDVPMLEAVDAVVTETLPEF